MGVLVVVRIGSCSQRTTHPPLVVEERVIVSVLHHFSVVFERMVVLKQKFTRRVPLDVWDHQKGHQVV